MNDERPLRVLPDFSNSDHVQDWSQEWETGVEREHAVILELIQGVAVESSFHSHDYKGRDHEAMNNLIAALDEYAFEPDDDVLKNNMLSALSQTPTAGTDMFSFARNRFLNQSSKQETDNIMQNIFGGNDDFPSP